MYKSAVDKNKHLRSFDFWTGILKSLGILIRVEGERKFIIRQTQKDKEEIDYAQLEQWLLEDSFLFTYGVVVKDGEKKETVRAAAEAA